jgi:hypothetical protein
VPSTSITSFVVVMRNAYQVSIIDVLG